MIAHTIQEKIRNFKRVLFCSLVWWYIGCTTPIYLSMFMTEIAPNEHTVIAMEDLLCTNSIQHSTVPKTSLARRNVNIEFASNPATASTPDRIMIRNNEIDFLILGDHQNVAKVREFKVIVVNMEKTLKKQAATWLINVNCVGNLWTKICTSSPIRQPMMKTFDAFVEFISRLQGRL